MNYFTIALSAGLTLFLPFFGIINFGIFAQTGGISTSQNTNADYAVSIVPGAAQRDSTIIIILRKLRFQLVLLLLGLIMMLSNRTR